MVWNDLIWFWFYIILENGDLIEILNHIFNKWFDLILNHISDDFWIPWVLGQADLQLKHNITEIKYNFVNNVLFAMIFAPFYLDANV
jgi:hypothetical protein